MPWHTYMGIIWLAGGKKVGTGSNSFAPHEPVTCVTRPTMAPGHFFGCPNALAHSPFAGKWCVICNDSSVRMHRGPTFAFEVLVDCKPPKKMRQFTSQIVACTPWGCL